MSIYRKHLIADAAWYIFNHSGVNTGYALATVVQQYEQADVQENITKYYHSLTIRQFDALVRDTRKKVLESYNQETK